MMLASSLPPIGFRTSASNQACARASDLRRVIGLGAGALQHEAVEGRELVRVEAQRRAAARQRMRASSVRVQSRTGMKL